MAADGFYIHDWDQWQEQWYKLQKNRKNDAERKRRAYAETSGKGRSGAPGRPEEPTGDKPSAKKGKSDKKAYSEFVKMTEANYNRLIELYGKEFTEACITKLDLYKGSKGKTYKDDYRAILSWVVRSVNEDNPGLMKKSKGETGSSRPPEVNPYAEWGGASG